MNLQEAMGRYRTLVLEGRDGLDRNAALAELARGGFLIRRLAGPLHHLDPARPYRELLTGSERLALDGGLVRELVYGPLHRGRSRVSWIEALDFAEAVAERDGALLHLRQPPGTPHDRTGPAMLLRSGPHPAATTGTTGTTTATDGSDASERLGEGGGAGGRDGGHGGHGGHGWDEVDRREESYAECAAYDRAFRTLAQHVPVVTIPAVTPGPGQ